MKLSIIIVNYNVRYFLEQCLYSVLQATRSIDAEVIVVDNDSLDGSVDYLQPLFPSVRFIQSSQNLGFGKANNLALTQANGEYVLFLNPDTLIPEDCFTCCMGFLGDHPAAGAVGVRMIDGSGVFLPESKRSFPNTATAFYKATGLAGLFPRSRKFNKYALGYLSDREDHAVDVLAGAFMMVRRRLLGKDGAFDEQFFMYGEDIDLSYRLKKSGYENWYLAQTTIIHFKGESLKRASLSHVRMFYNAMIVFVQKHYHGKGAGVLKLLLSTGITARALVSVAGRKVSKTKRKTRKPNSERILIVGSPDEFNECYKLYHLAGSEKSIIGRIKIHDEDTSPAIGTLQVLKTCCIENNITEVVFCQGILQYNRIIEIMESLGSSYHFRFHAAGSRSMVGSDSRSDTGIVIALV